MPNTLARHWLDEAAIAYDEAAQLLDKQASTRTDVRRAAVLAQLATAAACIAGAIAAQPPTGAEAARAAAAGARR